MDEATDFTKWRETFPLPIRMDVTSYQQPNTDLIGPDIEAEAGWLCDLNLALLPPGKEPFALTSLPVASDGCAYGDDEDQDRQWDLETIAYGRLFEQSGPMYKVIDDLLNLLEDGMRQCICIHPEEPGEHPADPCPYCAARAIIAAIGVHDPSTRYVQEVVSPC